MKLWTELLYMSWSEPAHPIDLARPATFFLASIFLTRRLKPRHLP
jgi:hypothetical protein